MRIKFYGTSASEGVPAVFCECKNCQEARKRGGKNLRTRTSCQIDDHFLIDFSMDSYAHTLYEGLKLSQIHHLLVTHSHEDHFFPKDLMAVNEPKAFLPQGWHLDVYGNNKVKELWQKASEKDIYHKNESRISFTELTPYKPICVDGYDILPVKANHALDETCLLYFIQHEGRSLLYAHDTNLFPEETWQALSGLHADCVVMDCTTTTQPNVFREHMSIQDNLLIKERMLRESIADENTLFIASHFAHIYMPLQEELEEILAPYTIIPAYDGMELEI